MDIGKGGDPIPGGSGNLVGQRRYLTGPGRRVQDDAGQTKPALKRTVPGIDVLDPRHRDHGARRRQPAMLNIDVRLADLVAPVLPDQTGDDPGRDRQQEDDGGGHDDDDGGGEQIEPDQPDRTSDDRDDERHDLEQTRESPERRRPWIEVFFWGWTARHD